MTTPDTLQFFLAMIETGFLFALTFVLFFEFPKWKR